MTGFEDVGEGGEEVETASGRCDNGTSSTVLKLLKLLGKNILCIYINMLMNTSCEATNFEQCQI